MSDPARYYTPRNPNRTLELDRLGDEIALLSAHLDAGTARLLTLIREYAIDVLHPLALRPHSRPTPGPQIPRPSES